MPVKIFQDKHRLNRHRFHVGQRLRRLSRVVDCVWGGSRRSSFRRTRTRHNRSHQPFRLARVRTQNGSSLRRTAPDLRPSRCFIRSRRCCVRGRIVRSRAQQSIGNAPLKGGDVQLRTRPPHQIHGERLLRRLHDHDGRRRIDQDFQSIERVTHGPLVILNKLILRGEEPALRRMAKGSGRSARSIEQLLLREAAMQYRVLGSLPYQNQTDCSYQPVVRYVFKVVHYLSAVRFDRFRTALL